MIYLKIYLGIAAIHAVLDFKRCVQALYLGYAEARLISNTPLLLFFGELLVFIVFAVAWPTRALAWPIYDAARLFGMLED